MAGLSPTQLTLRHYRSEGHLAAVTEKWNQWAKIRQDLFGFIDVVVVTDEKIIAVQATSGSNHSARKKKVLGLVEAKRWSKVGEIHIVSWKKVKNRWVPKIEVLSQEQFP